MPAGPNSDEAKKLDEIIGYLHVVNDRLTNAENDKSNIIDPLFMAGLRSSLDEISRLYLRLSEDIKNLGVKEALIEARLSSIELILKGMRNRISCFAGEYRQIEAEQDINDKKGQ